MCISQVRSPNGPKAVLPKQIAQESRDFYSTLYNLPDRSPPQTSLEDYISSSQLPKRPSDIQGELESPITLEELQQAVGGMKPGKTDLLWQLQTLLNIDLKLFTKILATHLAQQLQGIVHLDQVGFMPGIIQPKYLSWFT